MNQQVLIQVEFEVKQGPEARGGPTFNMLSQCSTVGEPVGLEPAPR
jgi:hypothetical protein